MLLWPLAQLPYRVAYTIWILILAAAMAGFVLLWPDRRAAALACCWSGALAATFTNTQELPLILMCREIPSLLVLFLPLLLWLALALRLRDRHPSLAGLALSLVWRYRLWRGFLAGAAALFALSFAAGAGWPRQYFDVLAHGPVHPGAAIMPNLHGLFAGAPHATVWEILPSVLIAAATWMVVRRTDFAWGLAAVLAGGLLVSYHAYLRDCAILLPALLIAKHYARYIAWFMWTPLGAVFLLAGHPLADVTRLAILAFFAALAHRAVAQARLPSAPVLVPAGAAGAGMG